MSLMLVNLALSPLSVVLPLFAKIGKDMPAWYLGALESSIALGAIAGAFSLNFLQAHLKRRMVMVLCIETAGLGILLLAWSPGLILPLLMVFLAGFGITASNIQTNTQIALVIPDSHRARFNSIIYFLCVGIMPLGVAGSSLLIARAGLSASLLLMGLMIMLLTPLLLWIPQLTEFLEVRAGKAGGFLKGHYPGNF